MFFTDFKSTLYLAVCGVYLFGVATGLALAYIF